MALANHILETGIDRLFELVNLRGRISVSEAAGSLSLSPSLIRERAAILEDEGLILVEHRLLGTFLISREINKKDVMKKKNEFNGRREVLVRKSEGFLSFLEREEKKFNHIRDEFSKMKKKLGFDLDMVKKSLPEIKKHSYLRKSLEQEIRKHKAHIKELDSFMKKTKAQIREERKRITQLTKKTKKKSEQMTKMHETEKKLKSFLNLAEKGTKTFTEINRIDKDRYELKKELLSFMRKAKAFDLSSNLDTAKEFTSLEKGFNEIDKKMSIFKGGLKRFLKFYS